MTNKEKYKQAFSSLHASAQISLEGKEMLDQKQVKRMRPALAACICAVIAVGGMGTAYAADVGGIQTKMKCWLRGESVDVEATQNEDGSYTYTFSNGESMEVYGETVDENGNTEAVSPEEILKDATNEVYEDEDGSVWIYWQEKTFEITDELNAGNGVCKVAFVYDGETIYFDITADDGEDSFAYASSTEPAPGSTADDYTMLE